MESFKSVMEMAEECQELQRDWKNKKRDRKIGQLTLFDRSRVNPDLLERAAINHVTPVTQARNEIIDAHIRRELHIFLYGEDH